jgi:hypothetical protein
VAASRPSNRVPCVTRTRGGLSARCTWFFAAPVFEPGHVLVLVLGQEIFVVFIIGAWDGLDARVDAFQRVVGGVPCRNPARPVARTRPVVRAGRGQRLARGVAPRQRPARGPAHHGKAGRPGPAPTPGGQSPTGMVPGERSPARVDLFSSGQRSTGGVPGERSPARVGRFSSGQRPTGGVPGDAPSGRAVVLLIVVFWRHQSPARRVPGGGAACGRSVALRFATKDGATVLELGLGLGLLIVVLHVGTRVDDGGPVVLPRCLAGEKDGASHRLVVTDTVANLLASDAIHGMRRFGFVAAAAVTADAEVETDREQALGGKFHVEEGSFVEWAMADSVLAA